MERKQFSYGGLVKAATVLSFDDANTYIGESDAEKIVSLEDVVSLSPTSRSVNNRYFWCLEYRLGDHTEVEEFRTNATLWNRNFARFHARLCEANPDAVKTPCRWWTA